MDEIESSVNSLVMKLRYAVEGEDYAIGDEDYPSIAIVPIQINWMNEDGKYTNWIDASDFDVESLDDYEDFFEREEKYFYEQDIYT
jgi:hypothetical protein|tara:strand:- start:4114 stop:4371 length:258 start_codon:yes stop_codon:yes gene_type:complete